MVTWIRSCRRLILLTTQLLPIHTVAVSTENPVKFNYLASEKSFNTKGYLDYSDKYELIVIAVRGGGYEKEWAGNFAITGQDDHHDGFDIASSKVKTALFMYMNNQKIFGNVKIWITGYSRAAAVANLVAADLDNGIISISP